MAPIDGLAEFIPQDRQERFCAQARWRARSQWNRTQPYYLSV